MRRLSLIAALCLLPLSPAAAQDQTLADIRQDLSVLFVEIQRLKRELSTTGSPQGAVGGVGQERVDAIEAALQQLTGKTEQLEFRINTIVRDGTNRIGDLEFRLCELEPNCDVAQLGSGTTLGGDVPAPAAAPAPQAPAAGGQFAVGEQGDFDRAKAAMDAGRFAEAADAFDRFNTVYPGSPLAAEAHLLRGDALATDDQWATAARAYLEAFSTNPDSPQAPRALLQLGTALNELGQTSEACLTLAEVEARYPSSAEVAAAQRAMSSLSCS